MHWADEGWWNRQIDAAIIDPDPVKVNARITLLHRELSLALTRVIGADAGPTYHAWAVWASLKAGRIVRKEEAGWMLSAMPIAGFAAGSAAALAALIASKTSALGYLAGALGAGLLGAIPSRVATNRALSGASDAILAGNVAVIDEVGRNSARFACAFARQLDRTPEALERFLEPLSPEPPSEGGQGLLCDAYRHYFTAADETDPGRRDQAMLLGNLSIVLHEHLRLQEFFDAAIPRPIRRAVTTHLLHFRVGNERLSVGRDVAPAAGADIYPASLVTIQLPALRAFLAEWDRTPSIPIGSGARDWCQIGDRMN